VPGGTSTVARALNSVPPPIGALTRSEASSSTLTPWRRQHAATRRRMPGRSWPTSIERSHGADGGRSGAAFGMEWSHSGLRTPSVLQGFHTSSSTCAAGHLGAQDAGELAAEMAHAASSQLPPWSATRVAMSCTRPGRSAPMNGHDEGRKHGAEAEPVRTTGQSCLRKAPAVITEPILSGFYRRNEGNEDHFPAHTTLFVLLVIFCSKV